MNELKQQHDMVISGTGQGNILAEKDRARILVVSDSHGGKVMFASIIMKFGKDADALCFCGDGIPDLLGMLEDSLSREELSRNIPPVIAFVQGNGDHSSYTLLTDERVPVSVPILQTITAAGKKILIAHGHRYNVYIGTKELKADAEKLGADIVFYGHTHIANALIKTKRGGAQGTKQKIALINPGSCSLPRGGLPRTFAIVDVFKDKPIPEYSFYEAKWNEFEELTFVPFCPPAGEINLFW